MNERKRYSESSEVQPGGAEVTDKKTVLIVDDDPALLEFVRPNLESIGFHVLTAIDAESAQWMLKSEIPDLVLFDVMLPRMNGFDLARWTRGISPVPIIMLTVKTDEADVIEGLRLGADDYVTKPFRIQELLARVQNAVRRSEDGRANGPRAPVLNVGDLVVDMVRRRVTVRGKEVVLTATEYKLLVEFASNPGKVLSHGDLLTRVWGPKFKEEVEYLRAYIRNLRVKIEEDASQPKYILSRIGLGYILEAPPK